MKMLTNRIAKKVLETCFGVKKEENFLIITDSNKFEIAKSFYEAGKELAGKAIIIEGPIQYSGEPRIEIITALEKADVCMMITTGSFTHTKARAEASLRGCRIASMPNITTEIIKTALDVDYNEIADFTGKLSSILDKSIKVHIETKIGTKLSLDINGRSAISDIGLLTDRGAFGNLPAGESMIAPVENFGDGIIYVDGAIGCIGRIIEPIKLEIENGRITNIIGDKGQLSSFLKKHSMNANKIAEFGIGTNKKAKIINNPICDEKVYSTIHIGFGNNIFMGGKQDCDIHYDVIIKEPTVYLDGQCIIMNGKHVYNN